MHHLRRFLRRPNGVTALALLQPTRSKADRWSLRLDLNSLLLTCWILELLH
uniref:Uncharacterized protein n=1 Tax=Arundo donax TaxID=35708 RepID=A0A0A9ARN9_ARUDO